MKYHATECVCLYCKKVFIATIRRKYCNTSCKGKYARSLRPKKEPLTIQCMVCGKTVKTFMPTQKICPNKVCRAGRQRIYDKLRATDHVIDPIREPFVQSMIRKYSEIKRILKENGISMNTNSCMVDYEIAKLRLKGVYVPV